MFLQTKLFIWLWRFCQTFYFWSPLEAWNLKSISISTKGGFCVSFYGLVFLKWNLSIKILFYGIKVGKFLPDSKRWKRTFDEIFNSSFSCQSQIKSFFYKKASFLFDYSESLYKKSYFWSFRKKLNHSFHKFHSSIYEGVLSTN